MAGGIAGTHSAAGRDGPGCASPRRDRRVVPHQQRDACLWLAVEGNVDRVQPRVLELHLLEVDDEIARAEVHVFRQRHLDGDRREVDHNRVSIRIDKVQLQLVFALVIARKCHPQCDRALRMHRGKLLGVNRVEGPQQVELAVVIRRRIAQNRHLNVHPQTMKPRISRRCTKFFCSI